MNHRLYPRKTKTRTRLSVIAAGSLLAASPWHLASLAQDTSTQSGSTPEMRMYNSAVVTGIIVGDPANGEMLVRARNGIFYRVRPHSGINLNEMRGGDRVRIFGNLRQQMLDGAGVRVLQRRYSSYAGDYGRRYATLTGNVTRGLYNGEFLLESV